MRTEIYVMHADGSEATRLTHLGGRASAPSWSPDGAWIAFAAAVEGGDREIYVMGGDGLNLVRLTQYPAEDDDPSWSPQLGDER